MLKAVITILITTLINTIHSSNHDILYFIIAHSDQESHCTFLGDRAKQCQYQMKYDEMKFRDPTAKQNDSI